MFFFEKYFSLYAFAIGWGVLVTVDFILRCVGLAGYHGIQTGLILSFAGPLIGLMVVLAFAYFLFSPDKNMGKKLFSGANFIMLMSLSTVLIIDLVLRLVAFNETYCLGMDTEAFAACKEQHSQSLWLDIFKIACMIRMMHYSTQVLEKLTDQPPDKEQIFD